MEQVAIGASYSVLKTTTSQLPTLLSAQNQSQVVLEFRTQSLQMVVSYWLYWVDMCCLFVFLHPNVCLRLGLFCWKPSPCHSFHCQPTPSYGCWYHRTKPLQGLWKLSPVTNFWLTSHLFFLLAPRQHWDQTQAPLSCNRDKMACVVLGFRGFWWVSFIGSPNLPLESILIIKQAGFICPVH